MSKLDHLFQRNLDWATSIKERDPDFFTNLSKQQAPDYMWIGCSDSRVPANQIVNLPPGEVFVHRNIANVVVHTDLNCLSVLQFAVDVLNVKHVVICGHYGCGGIEAAMTDNEYGLVDNWLRHVKDVYRFNEKKFDGLDDRQKHNLLCELNVKEQVRNISNTTIVKNAWKAGKELSIHGWVYNIENGILKDLDTLVSGG
ncbi:MAG: carbonate dehydratase [Pseudomonadales bacterium]